MKRMLIVSLLALLLLACAVPEVTPKTGGRPILSEEVTLVVLDPTPSLSGAAAVPFTAGSVRVGWYDGVDADPVTVLKSVRDLTEALRFERPESDEAALDSYFESYDDAFFAENELILVRVSAPSGSNRYEISGIERDAGGVTVTVTEHVPEVGTSDMAAWLLFAAVPAGTCTSVLALRVEQN